MLYRAKTMFILVAVLAASAAQAKETIVWKPLEEAILRIDDRAPKTWNVYRADKKGYLVLVQLGRRFLMLDSRAREIYELDPDKLQRKGKNLSWDEADRPAHPLPTADWMIRDVGPVQRIHVRLAAEGRVLEVQLPHPPDLRSLY
jgi:hypothetical protein